MRGLSFVLLVLSALPVHANCPLIACGHPDYPPFTWQEEDKIVGVGPEVAAAILKELGVELVSRYVGNWKRCQKEIKLGKVDMFLAAYKTNERESYADYVPTYVAKDPTAVFVWKERTFEFNTWNDLIGKRIGTNLGGSMGEGFDAFILEYLKFHRIDHATIRNSAATKDLSGGLVGLGQTPSKSPLSAASAMIRRTSEKAKLVRPFTLWRR